MSDFRPRLEQFLLSRSETPEIVQLTPDASTREYFRVNFRGDAVIASVYPEAFVAAEHSYLDVTALFLECGLPVARVLDFDETLGVIILEDFGDRILRTLSSTLSEPQAVATGFLTVLPERTQSLPLPVLTRTP